MLGELSGTRGLTAAGVGSGTSWGWRGRSGGSFADAIDDGGNAAYD